MSLYDIESIDLDAPNTSHSLVAGMVGSHRTVLDVGCATGYLGEALAARGCVVDGVERDAEAARKAETRLRSVVVADLDRTALGTAMADRTYDVIVFADVLEHLADPASVLSSALTLLRPGGDVIVSVPNVAHGSLRLGLLQGRWEYRETGLLDSTHLRFFTRASIVELLQRCGLSVAEIRATVVDPLASEVELDPSGLPDELVDWVRVQEDAYAYQFVLRATVGGQSAPVPPVQLDATVPEVDGVRPIGDAFLGLATGPGGRDDLRRTVLTLRDFVVGAEAELGTARREVAKARQESDNLREALRRTRRSPTWLLGQIVIGPILLLRRRWLTLR